MSRSLSWIDPGRLAEALAAAGVVEPEGAVRRRAEAGTDGGGPLWLRVAPGAPGAATGGSEALPLAPRPDGGQGLQWRLASFCDGVRGAFGARAVFVVDDAGLEVMARGASAELMSFSSSLFELMERLGEAVETPGSDTLALERADGEILYLLAVGSRLGRFVMGFTSRRPAGRRQRQEVRRRLTEVLDDSPDA